MNKKHLYSLIFHFLLFSFSILACSQVGDEPARIVEIYYQALVDKAQARMLIYSCATWETTAILEYDSFISVKTDLVDFTCQSILQEDNFTYVTCEGAISASYDGEIRKFPLDEQTFIVVNQGGEWFMCGYK
jgi:hypothetical protein